LILQSESFASIVFVCDAKLISIHIPSFVEVICDICFFCNPNRFPSSESVHFVLKIDHLLLRFFLSFTIPFIVQLSWIAEHIFIYAPSSLDHFGLKSRPSFSQEMNGIRCLNSVPWIRITKALEYASAHRLQRPEYVSIQGLKLIRPSGWDKVQHNAKRIGIIRGVC
jgi:hypothetical protein